MPLGLRGSGSWGADERPKNYRETILYLFPNSAPLTALLNKLKQEDTSDPEFKIFTKGLPSQITQIDNGAGYTSSATSLAIDAGTFTRFKAGHVLLVERTLELMWVTVDPTAAVLTVDRGQGSAAAALLDNDVLRVVGSQHSEGSDAPTAIYYDPSVISNYCQIFRNSYFLTNTGMQTELRTGKPKVEAKRETLELQAIEMEQAFFWGGAVEDSASNLAQRTTKGLVNFVTSNIKDFADAVTIDAWENFMEDVFEDGSNEKWFFCGNRAVNVLGKLARSHTQITSSTNDQVYGLNFQKWVTSYGTLGVVNHPLFSKSAEFKDWGFVVDPKYIIYRYLRGRDTMHLENRQNPGVDAIKNEFLTECGLEVQFESTHAVAKNMSAFSV